MLSFKDPLAFLIPSSRWDFQSGGHWVDGLGAPETGVEHCLQCARAWWPRRGRALGWGGMGWDGVCRAGPCLTRERLDLSLHPNKHLKYLEPEMPPVPHWLQKRKRETGLSVCFSPLKLPIAKIDQNFDHNTWNQHKTNDSRESIIWPASDEVWSYSVGSNLNQYKTPQNSQRVFAILPALYWCTTKWN